MGFFNIEAGGGSAFNPQAVIWESLDWVTLRTGSGAPTPATGGEGWFYADTTNQDLYGPATFDPSLLPAGVWDWGSPLPDTTFSWISPTNQSGDWYVWDEFDDGTSWILFQKKGAIAYGDMLFWDGANWEARSQKISAHDVYADLTAINSSYGVDAVKTQLQNLFTNYAQAYNGGNHYFIETNVNGTYEVSPFDGNGFILTVTDDTEITFASAWDPDSGLGTRFCELTLMIKQDSTGGWATTFGGTVYLSDWAALTSTADRMNILKAITWDGGTTWFVNVFGEYDLAP
jgi:hypothetical protein